MIAKTGCVLDEGKMRNEIQELRVFCFLHIVAPGLPSSMIVVFSATLPWIISSSGTVSVLPILAR
jgi:hypothetical protein